MLQNIKKMVDMRLTRVGVKNGSIELCGSIQSTRLMEGERLVHSPLGGYLIVGHVPTDQALRRRRRSSSSPRVDPSASSGVAPLIAGSNRLASSLPNSTPH
jgi:hypothetical protein